MDALSVNMQRRADSSYGISRWLADIEATRLRHYEQYIAKRFDSLSIITDLDKSYFPTAVAQRMQTIPNGIVVPPEPAPEAGDETTGNEAKPYDVVFTGNLGYFPNATAARLLVEHIMPQVWATHPDTRVALVGAEPGPDIRKLANHRVIVTGFVPSMTAELLKSRIFVAPLFAGSGLQNKLLEAMSVGLPVVCSPLPARSLGVEHQRECMVANNPSGFAQAIIQLLDAPEACRRLGLAGQRYVHQNFDWEQALHPLFEAWQNMLGAREP
jgi:glycosyltransferase involved in cell wall biosynthesis